MRQQWVGKRQSERSRVQLRAQLRFTDQRPAVECTIIDISSTGARITTPDGCVLPENFNVFIHARNETKLARLRWSAKSMFGVEFLTREGLGVDVVERLVRLENRLSQIAVEQQPVGEQRQSDRSGAPLTSASQPHAEALSALEERIAIIDQTAALQTSKVEQALFELASGLGGRLDRIEARLSSLEGRDDQIEHRLAGLDLRLEQNDVADVARTDNGAPRPGEGGSDSSDFEPRLRALEEVMVDLRSSLRILMSLTAARSKPPSVADGAR